LAGLIKSYKRFGSESAQGYLIYYSYSVGLKWNGNPTWLV